MLYTSIMKRSNFFENPQIAPTITPTVMLIAAHTNAREIEILDPYQIASNVDCPDAPVPSIQWMPAPSCDIAFAARDSEFDGKKIRKGEYMALENGKIVATGTDLTKITYRLARSMKKKDTQFITVISGCDVSNEEAEKTTAMVQAKCGNDVEVTHLVGGQPVYYYMISVE